MRTTLGRPLLLTICLLLGGCSGELGGEFLGEWQSIQSPTRVIRIVRNGDHFLVVIVGAKFGAKLQDGSLNVSGSTGAFVITHIKVSDTLTAPGLFGVGELQRLDPLPAPQEPEILRPGDSSNLVSISPAGEVRFGDEMLYASRDVTAAEVRQSAASPKRKLVYVSYWDRDFGGLQASIIDTRRKVVLMKNVVPSDHVRGVSSPRRVRMISDWILWSPDEKFAVVLTYNGVDDFLWILEPESETKKELSIDVAEGSRQGTIGHLARYEESEWTDNNRLLVPVDDSCADTTGTPGCSASRHLIEITMPTMSVRYIPAGT